MTKRAKEYMNAVIEILQKKYNMIEIELYKAVKSSFLYDSLLYYVDETIHNDIETNADFIYEDYKNSTLKTM